MRTHSSHTGLSSSHSAAGDTFLKMRSIRVALYVRVSTDKQAEFGMSLDAQRAELERYCRDRNWTIAGLYIDGGFSGKNTDRPEFQRMISAIHERGIVHRDPARKNKICSLTGHKATQRRRTEDEDARFVHWPV